jgi:hypothetical protein
MTRGRGHVVPEAALHFALTPQAARARVPARLADADLAAAGAGLLRLGVRVRAARAARVPVGLVVAGDVATRLRLVLAQLGLDGRLQLLDEEGNEVLLSPAPGEVHAAMGELGGLLLAADPIGASAPADARAALAPVAALSDGADQLVDPGIRLAVAALIAIGVRTEGSCEGHLSHAISHPPYVELAAADSPLVEAALAEAGLAGELVLVPEFVETAATLFPREWHDEAMRLLAGLRALSSATWLPLGRRLAERGELRGADPDEAARVTAAADRLNALGRARLAAWQGAFRRLGLLGVRKRPPRPDS